MKKRFDYAIILIAYLKQNSDRFVEIKEVSDRFGLPRAYLEKVAQELKRAEWLEGRRGAGGGYRLAKDPKLVSVESLISFYEPIYSFCPLLRKSEILNPKFETISKTKILNSKRV